MTAVSVRFLVGVTSDPTQQRPVMRLVFSVLIVSVLLILPRPTVAFDDPGKDSADFQSGLDRRVPWTGSRISGTPEPPPPYRVEPALGGLTFERPVVITNAPASDRLLVAELTGKIFSFSPDAVGESADLVIDLKQARPELASIYGLTFHPDYAQNQFVYVCYIAGHNQEDGTRVSRFRMESANPPQIDPESEQIVITWWSGGHNGGCIKFGPDGYLYVTTGDGTGPSPPDVERAGQDVSNLLSAILRIDVDHADDGRNYRVPADNPFVNLEGARSEIWSYGFRNPWKMSFDQETGDLWVGDVGWQLWEMIYRVERGGNYGWSIMEGRQPAVPEQEPGPTPIRPPTIDHPHSEAASITGGFVYRGQMLPDLAGAYVYGDYQTGIVWAARMEGDRVVDVRELAHTPLQLVGFGEDNDGELYLLDHAGGIFRLVVNPEPDRSRDFPRRLSETGLFDSLPNLTPAPGVLEYSINARHWADGTHSQRWLAVPGNDSITIDGKGNWQFPDGSVIAKTVSINDVGKTGATVRLETQILHREAESWRPYTYAWNEQQTDAELVSADGFSRILEVFDAGTPGGVREQTYRFAGRKECALCHNPWVEARTTIFGVQSASLLGVHVDQLDRVHEYAAGPADQLRTLEYIGLLEADLTSLTSERSPLVDPYDDSAGLNDRARAYLHVNCAHCHQQHAGGAANIVLTRDTPLEESLTVGVRPTQGTFGISDAMVISPGDPSGSVLLYRIAKLGGGRMPRIGSDRVDRRGVRLIADWIAEMPSQNATEDPQPPGGHRARIAADLAHIAGSESATDCQDAIERLASSTRGALALYEQIQRIDLPEDVRQAVISRTATDEAGTVRDLFEQFLPPSERIKRVGEVVNQAEILSLEADTERGRQIFFNDSATSCKKCHRVGETGETLGPDLTEIGKKYPRDQILQQILEPSKSMDPKYIPYLLETTQGRVFSGLLESKDDTEVVLKDAGNKVHRFATSDVETLVRQQKSLMPDLLLRDMTAQQVADLLAYLATLK